MPFTFDLEKSDEKSEARAGRITTDHGEIETPIFMPVGTAATVKGVPRNFLKEEINADIILGNTYHLYLRPGTEILKEAGGIHGFSGWDRPLLTDSGGYQVYSLADTRKIKEEGAMFQSHIDGSKHQFAPENVMDIQRVLGADIIMAFDECTPYPCEKDYARNSMHMTHRWLDRCMKRYHETEPIYGHHQELFPIVQGSVYTDLRKESAEYVCKYEAGGYAIGGLSVGEPHEDMYAMTEEVNQILPKGKPRYLMGVGTPENILESISRGVDMFDCVMPTRNARNGMLFTSQGIVNIRNKKWERVFESIDPVITPDYSFAYMRHLFVAGEMLGPIVASIQNLSFYLWMVREARKHIVAGDFSEWRAKVQPVFSQRL